MNTIQIIDWNIYQRDGEQFLRTARMAFNKGKKTFSQEALYNLTCMGIEKLVMAFLMKHGDLAENHTMADLLFALERHLGPNNELKEKLLYLDGFQEICDPDTYVIRKPDDDDIKKMISIGDDIYHYLSPHLN